MDKTYLSLSISRAMALEHPVGDPFGGPAYGQRNMPFIIGPAVGVAAAAVGVAAAGATIATVGAAALAVVGAIGAVATVAGLAMTLVGAVTGNKSLMKIGGIVGLAGGVAGLASAGLSAGIGMVSTDFAAATSAADAAAAANAGSSGLDALGNAVTGDTFTSGKVIGGAMNDVRLTNPSGLAAATAGLKESTAILNTPTPTAVEAVTSAKPSTGSAAMGSAPVTTAGKLEAVTNAPTGLAKATLAPTTLTPPTITPAAAPLSSNSFFSGITDFMGKPTTNGGTVMAGAGQLGGGALQGWGAQQNANANLQIAQQKLALEQQQWATANANANAIPGLNIRSLPITSLNNKPQV